MPNIKRVLEEFTSLPLFLGINFVLKVILSAVFYGIEVPAVVLLLAFLTTIGVYSLNKVTDGPEDAVNKPYQSKRSKAPFGIVAILCYLAVLILGASEGIWVFLTFLVPLAVGFIYSVKLTDDLPRLKEILGAKNVSVALSLAFTCSVVPALLSTVQTNKIFLVFMFLFIQLFINTVIFDITDKPGDQAAKIKTIPLRFEKKKTRQLLLILNSLTIPWLIVCFALGIFVKCLPIVIFAMLYTYGTIWYFTTHENKRLLAQTFVDGQWIPIAALALLVI
jgi:4-hydroxybenzoate polyprenyltransferase